MRIGGRFRGVNNSAGQTASHRRLLFQSLEQRQLLAGDLWGESMHLYAEAAHPADSTATVEATHIQHSSTDAAGNRLSEAADVGSVKGLQRYQGRLSRLDRIDLVRFAIEGPSRVRFSIDRLTRDADLHILDNHGRVIGSSENSGTSVDAVSGTLRGGEYYLAVTAQTLLSTSYRLNLLAQPIAVSAPMPDAPEHPGEREPAEQASDSPTEEEHPLPSDAPPESPVRIDPLEEVGTFGGRYDWNLNAIGAPEAWAAGHLGQGVTVAIIDTGVDLDHPDLVHQIYVNPHEIPGNGLDDDQNGYIDDIRGYDFVSKDAIAGDGNGHGTHVAGTVSAQHNGRGANGVAPGAKILPIRVLDDQGRGADSDVAEGIRYAADLGAQIINLSLGGTISQVIASAVDYATSLGSLVIAAAGNESASTPSYPARFSATSASVLSVGATDQNGERAAFSNGVGSSGAVQIDAPGSRIYSTYLDGRYALLSGTSMAAPHVAGMAALVLSANPDLTSSELRRLLTLGTNAPGEGSDSIGNVSSLLSVAAAAAGISVVTKDDHGFLVADSETRHAIRPSAIDKEAEPAPTLRQFPGTMKPAAAEPQGRSAQTTVTEEIERLDEYLSRSGLAVWNSPARRHREPTFEPVGSEENEASRHDDASLELDAWFANASFASIWDDVSPADTPDA